jgi:hypothetical protein
MKNGPQEIISIKPIHNLGLWSGIFLSLEQLSIISHGASRTPTGWVGAIVIVGKTKTRLELGVFNEYIPQAYEIVICDRRFL